MMTIGPTPQRLHMLMRQWSHLHWTGAPSIFRSLRYFPRCLFLASMASFQAGMGQTKAIGKKKILNNNSCLNALSSKANLNPEKLLIVAKYSLLIPLFFLAEVAFWFFFDVFCKFYSNMLTIIY